MKKHSLEPSVILYSTEQIKDIEQRYAEQSTAGTYPLMERAGAIAFHQLISNWHSARRILIVTGKGNNAGDGFVVARLAAEQRLKVYLCELADPKELKGDALAAYKNIPHRVINRVTVESVKFGDFDVIVDAILGTGIVGKIREPYLSTIKRINANRVPVLSIDIPTGLEANTGFVHSDAVRADITTTFVGHKRGLYTGDAARYRGRVKLFGLDIPNRFYEKHEFHLFSQNWSSSKHLLKPREMTCHKGLMGHTVIIGGYIGMSGAAILSSGAAARCGSGLTSAWVGEQCAASVVNHTPEVMALNVELAEIKNMVKERLSSNHTMVVGPGSVSYTHLTLPTIRL
ncbi:MAG: NAD(P)H-hydrate epimerase, partial [Gammaproteobacteria bacterium]|nr:NAD(P)H-hydrate epimerase [Gammaproteobacteria bacterium]